MLTLHLQSNRQYLLAKSRITADSLMTKKRNLCFHLRRLLLAFRLQDLRPLFLNAKILRIKLSFLPEVRHLKLLSDCQPEAFPLVHHTLIHLALLRNRLVLLNARWRLSLKAPVVHLRRHLLQSRRSCPPGPGLPPLCPLQSLNTLYPRARSRGSALDARRRSMTNVGLKRRVLVCFANGAGRQCTYQR